MHPVAFSSAGERTSQGPRVAAVIPARLASARLPEKPLADIAGRPMIEHVYRRAAAARRVHTVIVATDDARIAAAVEAFGGVARMTSSTHRTGTDRIAEVAADLDCDIIVNVQGDLPLIDPAAIDQVVASLAADDSLPMATVRTPITDAADYANPNVVKVVVARNGDALYFSRAAIPHVRPPAFARGATAGPPIPRGAGTADVPVTAWKHLGLYAYRRAFVPVFAALPPTPLEMAESLEQLRALEHGYRIRVADTTSASIEVDTPEDLERVRQHLAAVART